MRFPSHVLMCPLILSLLATSTLGQQTVEDDVDLLDMASGAVVLSVSSEYNEEWAGLRLLDGSVDGGWCTKAGAAFPHEILIELANPSKLESIVFDNTKAQESSDPGISARAVEVWVSTTGADSGFSRVLDAELTNGARTEAALPANTEARWLKVVIRSNWGNGQYTELMELEAKGEVIEEDVRQPPLAGVYNTNYNLMLFEQKGQQVRGCYDWDGGVLTGTTNGRVVQFEWREDEGGQVGTAIMVLSSDGMTLNGLWYEGGSYRGLWNGTRETGDQRPKCTIKKESAIESALGESGHAIVYGIYFDLDSGRLRDDSQPVLEEIKAALDSLETLELVIEGHTDVTGSAQHNQDLAHRRAQSVVRWLVEHGIDAKRLEAKGYGASRPVADNDTAQGRALNRRVELKRR